MNEPKADLKAFSLPCLFSISPAKAPKNGPIISPKGGKTKIPAIRPMVAPQTPLFVPPNFLVPHIGI